MIRLRTLEKTVNIYKSRFIVCQMKSELIFENQDTKSPLMDELPDHWVIKLSKRFPKAVVIDPVKPSKLILRYSYTIDAVDLGYSVNDIGTPEIKEKCEKLIENTVVHKLYEKAERILSYIRNTLIPEYIGVFDLSLIHCKNTIEDEKNYILNLEE